MISEGFTTQKLLLLIVYLISKVTGEPGKKCNITDLSEGVCPGPYSTCIVTENSVYGTCDCIPGYDRVGSDCVKSSGSPDHGETIADSHALAWTLSALIFIAIVIVGVYLSYKHGVISWLKYKLNQRYNRSYDDVMIGQDDE